MTRKTYRWNKREKRMVEITPPARRVGVTIIEDCFSKNPTPSIIDGTYLDSRAKVREHEKIHDVDHVGNDQGVRRSILKGRDYTPAPGLRADIEKAWSERNA